MNSNPLLLTKGPKLIACSFQIKDIKSDGEKKRSVKCVYTIGISDNDGKENIVVRVGVRSDARNLPFKFKVELEAEFSCSGESRPDEKIILATVLPYFFPVLQGYVADFSGRAHLKPLFIKMPLSFSPLDND